MTATVTRIGWEGWCAECGSGSGCLNYRKEAATWAKAHNAAFHPRGKKVNA